MYATYRYYPFEAEIQIIKLQPRYYFTIYQNIQRPTVRYYFYTLYNFCIHWRSTAICSIVNLSINLKHKVNKTIIVCRKYGVLRSD